MATVQKDFLVKNGLTAGGQTKAPSFNVTLTDDVIQATSNVDSWFYNNELSISGQETEARDLFFKSDGTKLYVLGNAGDDITEYNLSTAWDVTTATAGNTFSVATQETTPHGLFFKDDGTAFYICGLTTVYQYNMSSAWDISTASYANKSFSVSSQDTNAFALHFSSDGTKMFISGSTTLRVYQYTLSTAWDVSTASYSNKSVLVSSIGTAPQGLSFNSNGTSAYVLFAAQAKLAQYNLSTAWDISTATYVDFLSVASLGPVANILGGLSGIYYNSTVGKAYLCDYVVDKVIQLNVVTPTIKISGNKLTLESDTTIEGHAHVEKNLRINGSVDIRGNVALSTNATFTGLNQFTWSSTGASFLVSSQTSGLITFGGTAGTGTITLGQSTVSQTVNVASGATASGSTKTLNIGTSGVSGSTTTITVGSSAGTSNTTINGNTTLGSAGTNTTTIAGQLSANGGVGSAGQVLTSRGANLSPEWTTVSGGGGGTTTYALTIGTGLSGTSFNGSAAVTIAIDSTVVTLEGTQTLTNKTLTSPDINGGTADSLTSLSVRDTSAAFDVIIGATSSTTLTANRALTLDVVNAARTVKLAGNIDLAANFSTVTGAITLTGQAGGSSVTLPSSGTLATLAGTETLSNKTLDGATLGTGGSNTTTIAGQLSANGGVGTSGQVLTSRGANLSPEWTTVSGGSSGVTITDDTSTNATRYLAFTDQTSGTETTLNVASTKLTYNPSTGALSSTDFNSTSDAKLKKNVVPAKGLEVVNKLHGYEFDFIDNGMHASGVIAQEIEEVLPHLVKDNIDHKTVAYMQIIPYLIESIKELSQEVNALKNKLGYK